MPKPKQVCYTLRIETEDGEHVYSCELLFPPFDFDNAESTRELIAEIKDAIAKYPERLTIFGRKNIPQPKLDS